MTTATAGTQSMGTEWHEVERMAAFHKAGVVPLKAVAATFQLHAEAGGRDLTAEALAELAGATKNGAYAAIKSIRAFAAAQPIGESPIQRVAYIKQSPIQRIHESANQRIDDPPPPDVSPPTPPPSFPPPPGVCVSTPASAHAHEAEPEPFIADDPTPLADDEWVEVERQVTRLANSTHAGEQAEAAGRAGMWPKSWLIEAATETGAKRIGAMGAWKYMRKILLRWEAAGASDMDAERAEARAIAATAPPSIPIRASPAPAFMSAAEKRDAKTRADVEALRARFGGGSQP